MLAFVTHPDCLLHEMGEFHPESPARLQAIEDTLKTSNLISTVQEYSAPLATREQLLLAHKSQYIDEVFAISPMQ